MTSADIAANPAPDTGADDTRAEKRAERIIRSLVDVRQIDSRNEPLDFMYFLRHKASISLDAALEAVADAAYHLYKELRVHREELVTAQRVVDQLDADDCGPQAQLDDARLTVAQYETGWRDQAIRRLIGAFYGLRAIAENQDASAIFDANAHTPDKGGAR